MCTDQIGHTKVTLWVWEGARVLFWQGLGFEETTANAMEGVRIEVERCHRSQERRTAHSHRLWRQLSGALPLG